MDAIAGVLLDMHSDDDHVGYDAAIVDVVEPEP